MRVGRIRFILPEQVALRGAALSGAMAWAIADIPHFVLWPLDGAFLNCRPDWRSDDVAFACDVAPGAVGVIVGVGRTGWHAYETCFDLGHGGYNLSLTQAKRCR